MVKKHAMKRLNNPVSVTILSLVVVALLATGCGERAEGDALTFEALLAGQPVGDSSPTNPIALRHEEITDLTLLITNTSDRPVTMAHVRLEGSMLGLIFLTYDTGINEAILPGEERVIRFPIDFFDLDGQAHGLLRGQIRIFDADRVALGSTEVFLDGRGSPTATMSMFTLVLAAFAAASLAWNLYRLSLRKLPAERLLRGLRFVHTGIAIGLTLSAASSSLRIWPLPAPVWILVTLVCAAGGFVVGSFSPGSDDGLQFPVINLTDQRGEPIRIANQQ